MIFRRKGGRPWYMPLNEPGCVMCRLVRESEEQWLWNLLYEYTGDPQVHARFADSLGLCGQHADLMRMVVEKRQLVTPSGVARLYDTVSREELSFLPRAVQKGAKKADKCPLCQYRDQASARKASFLARALRNETWQEEYALSDGLCQGHFEAVLEQADRSVAEMLRDDYAKRLENLSHRLQELQRKQRYDVSEKLTPEEASSWREGLWRFGGMSFDHLLVND